MHAAYGGKQSRVAKLRDRLIREDAGRKGFHSRSYHHFFEGYTEYRLLQPDGKVALKREYTGAVYRPQLSKAGQAGIKLLYLLILLTQLGLLGYLASLGRGSDSFMLMALTEMVSLLALAAFIYTLIIDYVCAPKLLTVGAYKAGSRMLIRRAKLLAILFAADALVNAVINLVMGQGTGSRDWLGAAGFILCAGLAFSISFIEQKIPYTESEGKTSSVEGIKIEA